MASDGGGLVIEEMIKQFRRQYPKAPTPEKLWSNARKHAYKDEVELYYNGDSKIPRYHTELVPLRYLNFVATLYKNYRHLENAANSINMDHDRGTCERQLAEFQLETTLKSSVMRAIMAIPKYENFSSDFKGNDGSTRSRHELLMRGETELQVILKERPAEPDAPSERLRAERYNLNTLYKDRWHPMNLSMNFDMFKRYTTLILLEKKNPRKEFVNNKGDESTFKRHYLKYFFKCAESDQEFLLAVISFGTDVRFYPSKVLEFLRDRKLLKDEFMAGYVPQPQMKIVFSVDNLTIPKRNAEYLKKFNANPLAIARKASASSASSAEGSKGKPLIQIVKLIDLTDDVDVDNFNDNYKSDRKSTSQGSSTDKHGVNNINSNRSRGSEPSSGKTGSISNSKDSGGSQRNAEGGSNPSSSGSKKPSNPASSNSKPFEDANKIIRTVTQDVKNKEGKTNLDTNGKPIGITRETFRESTQKLWQMFFEPGFSLSSSMAANWYQLYINHAKTFKAQLNNVAEILLKDRNRSCYYDIPRLHPSMVIIFKAEFAKLQLTRRNSGSFNMSTVEGIMHSQTSPLQLSLLDPKTSKFVPGPLGWSPTNVQMPYQAFEGHLEWRLSQTGKALDGLEIEMVKLRYVEYLAIVAPEPKQFVLGVFTAYGPDLYLYPTRVLQLLKKKQLFRPETRLYSSIPISMDGRTYTALVAMKTPAPNPSTSFMGDPSSFDIPLMPDPPMQPHFQRQGPPMEPLMELQTQPPQFEQNYFGAQQQQQYPYQDQMHQQQHPMNDFPHHPNEGFGQGMQDGFGNQYQQDPFMQRSDSQYINPMPPPQPVPVPAPLQLQQMASNSGIMNNVSQPIQQSRPEPLKTAALPSILPMELWKSACEKCLKKYGPKYGITGLSDNDYKVLYDRYLFDTFDNPDDFIRGILTGISLARYPRDEEEPISTSGLLKLPPVSTLTPPAPPDLGSKPLKPILKTPAAPNLNQSTPSKNSISMSREDLLRISSLIERLIPESESGPATSVVRQASPSPRGQDPSERSRLVDYNHHTERERDLDDDFFRRPSAPRSVPPPPQRRSYEGEKDNEYGSRRQIIDYDHSHSSQRPGLSNSQDFFRRSDDTFGSSRSQGFNPIKRPSDPADDMYDNLLQSKRRNLDLGSYNYR